jgi:hypothetical protein
MEVTKSSDRSLRGLVRTRDLISARRRQDPESGQAMVEFALILFPLLVLVSGIIWFGIALNFWLDEQRLANQGARWAVVNAYPGCPRTDIPPTIACGTGITLQRYIACQPIAGGLKPTATISFPSGASTIGEPVKVELSTPFKFVPILNLGTITLRAKATMRLEQDASRFAAGSYTPGACP